MCIFCKIPEYHKHLVSTLEFREEELLARLMFYQDGSRSEVHEVSKESKRS